MDQDEVSPEGSAAHPGIRACDACRARKVRCDRERPCSNCLHTGVACTAGARPREKRTRILLTPQYEQKIDRLERRLDVAIDLLQQLARATLPDHAAAPAAGGPLQPPSLRTTAPPPLLPLPPAQQPLPPPAPIRLSPLNNLLSPERPLQAMLLPPLISPQAAGHGPDGGPTVVQGDSSLSAHSAFASSLAARYIAGGGSSTPAAPGHLDMRQTLDVLARIVATLKRPKAAAEMLYPNSRRPGPRRFEMPPVDKAMALVGAATNGSVRHLNLAMRCYNSLTKHQFPRMCQNAYISGVKNEYDYIILLSGLSSLSWMHAYASPPPERAAFLAYDRGCRVLLETALSSLPLHLPARPDVITALLLGAYYTIEISKPSLAWILLSKASELCQTLGYHSIATVHEDTRENAQHRLVLFWTTFMLDKCLSLRLGRPSTLPQSCITAPYPSGLWGGDASAWGNPYFEMFIEAGRCHGEVYEMLYSPGAMAQPAHVRLERVSYLASQIQGLEDRSRRFNNAWYDTVGDAIGRDFLDFNNTSDEVLRLSLLTLIFRAEPRPPGSPTTFSCRCVDAARLTLERHEVCMSVVSKNPDMYFPIYVCWILLFAPFIPFIVLFCQVIETQNGNDLAQMRAFVQSIRSATALTPDAGKMNELFQALYNVASHYVDMSQSQTAAPGSAWSGLGREPATAEMHDYLTALGFPNRGVRVPAPDEPLPPVPSTVHMPVSGGPEPATSIAALTQQPPPPPAMSLPLTLTLPDMSAVETAPWMISDWLHSNQAMVELMHFSDYITEEAPIT